MKEKFANVARTRDVSAARKALILRLDESGVLDPRKITG